MKKLKWLYHTPVMKNPSGLVHIIFNDDTEEVLNSDDVNWNSGWEGFDQEWQLNKNKNKKIISYVNVDSDYKNDFDNGKNKAVDSLYLMTSKLLNE